MDEIFGQIKYATDTNLFYISNSKRGLKEESLRSRLGSISPVYRDPVKAASLIESIKMVGAPLSALFPASTKKIQLNMPQALNLLYEKIKPRLNVLIKYQDTVPQIYYINDKGEHRFWANADADNFLELVLKESTINYLFTSAYESEDESAIYVKLKMVFSDFVAKIFDIFRADFEKRLNIEPILLSWDPAIPAFKQFSPSLLVEGLTPKWDSLVTRMDYPEIFMSYVWSIFEPTNNGRQALWIYGKGHEGKSTAINALFDFIGREYVFTVGGNEAKGAHFFGSVFGKRVGAIMDCENPWILNTSEIRNILGGDSVTINDKYAKPFTAKVHSKIFILSNKHPMIDYDDLSQRSRLLFIKMKERVDLKGSSTIQQELVDELPAFLFKCKKVYAAYCPTNSNLKVPEEMDIIIENNCSATDSENLDDFIDKYLEFGAHLQLTRADLQKRHIEVFGAGRNVGQSSFSFNKLVEVFLNKHLKVERVKLKSGGKMTVYKGVGLKKIGGPIDA